MNASKHPEMQDDKEEYEITAADVSADSDGGMIPMHGRLRSELEHGEYLSHSIKQASKMLSLYFAFGLADSEDIFIRSTPSGLTMKVWCSNDCFERLSSLNDQIVRGLTREARTERVHYHSVKKYDMIKIEE